MAGVGSKSAGEAGSPILSTSVVPQLRASRRASFASLTSNAQVGKETLSQALDQIHSTASKSENLTAFNEYTSPPPSSSGTDSKSIASELQGGLSGLYTRFRSSVGNVKDIVALGGEDAGGDSTSIKSSQNEKQSPVSSNKSKSRSRRINSPSTADVPSQPSLLSERQSPVGVRSPDLSRNEKTGSTKHPKVVVGSATASSKSIAGSVTAVKSPQMVLTQASIPTTISPALAEINISAVKQTSLSDPQPSEWVSDGPARSASSQNPRGNETAKEDAGDVSSGVKASIIPGEDGFKTFNEEKDERQSNSRRSTPEPERLSRYTEAAGGSSQALDNANFSSPVAEGIFGSEIEVAPLSRGSEEHVGSELVVTDEISAPDDVSRSTIDDNVEVKNEANTAKTAYQHLELPTRNGLAPPLVIRCDSTKSIISQTSSLVATEDGSLGSPIKQSFKNGIRALNLASKTQSSSFQPTSLVQGHIHDRQNIDVASQVKNKVLSKQYWMKDENAKDCFYCADPFSTFRRKHHCRTCGQIFDSKCTSLISGVYFGQAGSLRVCIPCESMIKGEDDSSEFSDDGTLSIRSQRPRHGSAGASDVLAAPVLGQSPSKPKIIHRSSNQPDHAIPTMSIPATRKAGGESNRKPTVLEIDAERTLARPTSSRSLKSSFASKPYHSAHRRHNSRHILLRGFKPIQEDRAPFHQNSVDEKTIVRPLQAFHDDNIIDPDLAPYLSDEGSSGDEQMSLMAVIQGDELSQSYDNDRPGFSGLLASSRKARPRAGEKSLSAAAFPVHDVDNQSLSGSRTANAPRSFKRRNLSVTNKMQPRPSPRSYRASPALPISSTNLHEVTSSSALAQTMSSYSPAGGSRIIRSSSMQGTAAPAVELNLASLRHVRKLLHQLLESSKIANVVGWEKALIPILLRATDDVNPDVQNGDDIDIRHYVKLKKIPGGRPGDTSYVSGLVFTKNLALKCMPRTMSHPNILILSFPLEYARHQLHFMSLEPVIRQEREFLQNLVNRIAALKPQLLLVERNVSGLALEFLQKANIATAYNVKASVLEAVARCCQTRIISSIDKLAIKPAQAGKCSSFYLKTYINDGRKKTYMFLSGCAKELGCTLVLRGDTDTTLSKMKRITEFMIYVVYNLKLETCLMRDEFAAIPSCTELGTLDAGKDRPSKPFGGLLSNRRSYEDKRPGAAILTGQVKVDALSQSASNSDTSKRQAPGFNEIGKSKPSVPEDESVPDDIPMPTFYTDMVEEHKTKILSASPFVKFVQPYLLMRAREQERRLAYLRRLRDQDIVEEKLLDEKSKPQRFDLIQPEMVHERVETASKKVREVLHAVHDTEYDKALHNYQTQSKQWETHISTSIDLFDPYAHQNIAVLYSLVCTETTVPCSGPDILAFDFYNENEFDVGFEADCTLGQYVEDLCLGANTVCTANGCERNMIDHHRQYVHGEAQISVFVEQFSCKLRGLQDTILMWSTCRKCDKETQVLPMSASTWKYSFGKYLELSFWSSELRARAGICPHDLHRDHLRFFGFKDVALRLQYDPITLVEIIVPRARITWKVDNDLRFKNDLFTKIESRINRFMSSVKARIKSINTGSVLPEKTERCKEEVEKLSKSAAEEHLALIQKLREKYMDSKHYEIIPLNRALRAVQEKVAEWDAAFADFDQNFFPSEKDIRRLTTLQLRKIFLDRDGPIQSLDPVNEDMAEVGLGENLNEKVALDERCALAPQTRQMSPEKAHDMLAAVVERHASSDSLLGLHQNPLPSAQSTVIATSSPVQENDREDLRHLDLALSSNQLGELDYPLITSAKVPEPMEKSMEGDRENQSSRTLTSVRLSAVPADSLGSSKIDANDAHKPAGPSHPLVVNQGSSIPRPVDTSQRRIGRSVSPTLSRTQSHPVSRRHLKSASTSSDISSPDPQPSRLENPANQDVTGRVFDGSTANKEQAQGTSDQVVASGSKRSAVVSHSMIPRSVAGRRKDSKVSNLARHFEQLSKEFEKERIRERRQRVAQSRQARAYPMAASKPIVQIYRNVDEAVEEKEPSDEDLLSSDQATRQEEAVKTVDHMVETTTSRTPGDDGFHVEGTNAENTETDENTGSDVDGDEDQALEDAQSSGERNHDQVPLTVDAQLDFRFDLPKHEKTSLMKMLTNFWAERSASGWKPLDYPLNATDHIFADSNIIVREDEPSSLIAFALGSEDYQAKLRSILQPEERSLYMDGSAESGNTALDQDSAKSEESILRPTGKHLKYQFSEGSAKMLCKVFYAEQFDALRKKCGVSERFVESLSRCMKWDSKGGKTKSVFLKTLDDRFVLKSLSPIETQAFLQFAPGYFYVMSRFLFHDMPSVIAKMLGFFQITIKNPATGVDFNWSLLVMENLFYDRSPTRTFDLKGSMRNRRIQSTGEQNEVLLDENMVDFIYATPLFSREHSKRLLRASVYNDTLFLAKQNVMDYSLMVAIDEDRKELVVGIIDCIRTYTWDKKLETWIKDRGKNRPTVTSPKEYKSRFREAMSRYVLQAPNCWHQFNAQHVESRPLRTDEQGDDKEVHVNGV